MAERLHLRKIKKPLMEKKRRARINTYLEELKSLIVDSLKHDATSYSKLEKADVLELAVQHLSNIRQSKIAGAMLVDTTLSNKFLFGYSECLHEVHRYLGYVERVKPDVQQRLLSYLGRRLERVDLTSQTALTSYAPDGRQAPVRTAAESAHFGIRACFQAPFTSHSDHTNCRTGHTNTRADTASDPGICFPAATAQNFAVHSPDDAAPRGTPRDLLQSSFVKSTSCSVARSATTCSPNIAHVPSHSFQQQSKPNAPVALSPDNNIIMRHAQTAPVPKSCVVATDHHNDTRDNSVWRPW